MAKHFLDRAVDGEDHDTNADLEEQYERMFPKIGRDFVYKDDLYKWLDAIMLVIDPFGLSPIDLRNNSEARKKALQYKSLLDAGKDGSSLYRDLINLDDD